MKFYIYTILFVLSAQVNTTFARNSPIPKISGTVVDSSTSSKKPLKFVAIKICSTTKNVTCNEYTTNEAGKFVAFENANDTYNVYVSGVMKTTVELKDSDIEIPALVVVGGGGGSPGRKFMKKPLK